MATSNLEARSARLEPPRKKELKAEKKPMPRLWRRERTRLVAYNDTRWPESVDECNVD